MSEGTGYKVEIAALKSVLRPLEESTLAAKDVRDDKSGLSANAQDAGSQIFTEAVDGFVEAWQYGMKQLVEYADDIVEKLDQTIDAYEKAEQLNIEGFVPTEENLDILPQGDSGMKEWKESPPELPSDKAGWEQSADDRQQGFENWMFG
ncbi:hypothetical protein [Streptomyces sp. HNM0574]|uniref:hypothetical protein n=1 Tax=Streptomyces sp. HNM0574 TaxID=2714954 RepID=UPI00146E425D|nr:hypothetical protein [Streptomyces sp. HNM0574]NLU68000.1 hypothetical protein [Streptomyces sp. HNM0574]